MKYLGGTIVLFFLLVCCPSFAQVSIALSNESKPVLFGLKRMEQALKSSGQTLQKSDSKVRAANITIQVSDRDIAKKENYEITQQAQGLLIKATDSVGAMYALLDVAEQINAGKSLSTIVNKKSSPHFSVRALKFNLPWSPYRTGAVMEQHTDVCRDLKFWERFLDMMAENRFNTLSLWNVHPFSFMVKPTNFPKANSFSESEMSQWKTFWTSLFRMAKERGIQTFIVNWNIAVSPEFAKAYGVMERNDTSQLVKQYTKQVVTQVINEYPDLAGIGITLADWMGNFSGNNSSLPTMTPKDREDWIEETVVAGIKAAKRPIQFLHRSVLSSDPQGMRRVINNANLKDTTLVEIKFNWSHGHSTPVLALTHDSHSGKTDNGYWEPMPDNYRIQWMIRNEDFFILRWGQPDFIRGHIAQNSKPYVNGYFVGSEGYIPAKEVAHKNNDHKNWQYAFEKHWLFYNVWGRLLYDPTTSDHVFINAFNHRYGKGIGNDLFRAYSAASKMPLRLASFHAATWDYTLYSEGFLAPFPSNDGLFDKVSSFISIDELIQHKTLDPSYISISDFVLPIDESKNFGKDKVTPLALADSLANDSKKVLAIVQRLKKDAKGALRCELDDIETWAYLSDYFSLKLKAGVALHSFRLHGKVEEKQKAIGYLSQALVAWKKLSSITAAHYNEGLYVDDHSTANNSAHDAKTFYWSKYLPQVERDLQIAKDAKPLNSAGSVTGAVE